VGGWPVRNVHGRGRGKEEVVRRGPVLHVLKGDGRISTETYERKELVLK